jgi:hypothetical protein
MSPVQQMTWVGLFGKNHNYKGTFRVPSQLWKGDETGYTFFDHQFSHSIWGPATGGVFDQDFTGHSENWSIKEQVDDLFH